MNDGHVVVAGATGFVGRAAMEHFARGGGKTTATARRRPFNTYGATFISVDLADEQACRNAFAGLCDVTQIVFAAHLSAFLGQSVQFAEWVFARSAQGAPGTISTIKLRRAGFDETVYSDEMFRKWFARYQESRLLPPR